MSTVWPRAEPIRTERLDLEPLTAGHAPEMVTVLADPALYAFTGGTPPTLDELTGRYTRQAKGVSPDGAQGWLNWIVRHRVTHAALGTVQATLHRTGDEPTADVAWVVGTRHQGQGIAAEAATAMLTWLRSSGITAIKANIHPDHTASKRVARRLGLEPTDEMTDGEQKWAHQPGGARGRASL